MKFIPGDETDSAHCTALKHEFLRCEDAFKEFEMIATYMLLQEQKGCMSESLKRHIAYKTYNAYSKFLHHLYEFVIGAAVRDRKKTGQVMAEDAEKFITAEIHRILSNRRNAIIKGTAPTWENHLSYYPEKVPQDFAKHFRDFRNKTIGHVTHERSTLSLSEFYAQYHKYIYMIYYSCLGHWGRRESDFPDLKEITDFSLTVKKEMKH